MELTLQESWSEVFQDGTEKVHVIADFDGTLTQEYYDGKRRPSIISVLRDEPEYLSPEYQIRAHQLFDHYHPFEKDTSQPLSYRKAQMEEWWRKAYELLVEFGLNKRHLEKLANNGVIEFRPGAKDFLRKMSDLGIPVVIMSASGLGEIIKMFCHSQGVDFPNIHYAVNQFEWNEDGSVKSQKGPIIHSLNKDETTMDIFPDIHEQIRHRTNVVLLGNSLGDAHMCDGFPVGKLVKIGFLDQVDPQYSQQLVEFSKVYDFVLNQSGYQDLNKLIV